MTKCDFCRNSGYYSNGQVYCDYRNKEACAEAAKLFAEVIKSQNQQTKTVNKNINKTYKNKQEMMFDGYCCYQRAQR